MRSQRKAKAAICIVFFSVRAASVVKKAYFLFLHIIQKRFKLLIKGLAYEKGTYLNLERVTKGVKISALLKRDVSINYLLSKKRFHKLKTINGYFRSNIASW